MPAKGKGRGKAASNHQLASTLPKGTELKDLRKKLWYLGEPIGSGGFGLIYLADEEKKSCGGDKAKFVVKVEPHGNGPLYCEVAFYQRAARHELLETWRKSSHLPYVGIPPYIAHGLHTEGSENLRFMVMPRFGCDIHKLWLKANKQFQRATVSQLAIELLNSLEYMHNNEYVHADIKGANILLGHENPNQIYLVDFGLAFRYMVDGNHKEYREDPRKAHDGTIEYTSRDAHKGVAPSRRADLEILGYTLLHWLSGRLPWEDNLTNKNYVKEQKIKHMNNVEEFVASVYPESKSNKEIEKYLQTVSCLEYEEVPNYDMLRKYFKDALKSMKINLKSNISFNSGVVSSTPAKKKRSTQSRAKPLSSTTNLLPTSQSSQSEDEEILPKKRQRRAPTKQNETNSTEEDLSIVASSATSEDSPPKIVAHSRKRNATSAKKPAQRSVNNSNKRKIIKSSSDENTASSYSTDENGHFSDNLTAKKSKVVKQLPKKKTTSQSSNEIKIVSTTSEDTDTDVVVNSTFETTSPRTRSSVKNSSPESSPSVASKSGTSNISKSRYSMAPLHTKSVLGKYDSLSGKTSGKHPVIIRRRKVRRPGTNVTTQTTPSLDKKASRV